MTLTWYILLLTLTCLASNKAETCQDENIDFDRSYVAEGEPLYVHCPLKYMLYEGDFNITWYLNGSEISFNTQSRVHQNQNYLKFLPARLEDSKYYTCVLRNSTFCIQKHKKVDVFTYDENLCYNKSTLYPFTEQITQNIQLPCPELEDYIDVKDTNLKWFKECLPLDTNGNKYFVENIFLTITNVTQQDEGKYSCEVPLNYNGTSYTISRSIDLDLQAIPIRSPPSIVRPTNNILSVALGSPVHLTCEVMCKGQGSEIHMYWSFNNSYIDSYEGFNERVKSGELKREFINDSCSVSLDLNFTEVKEEDYDRKFVCNIYSKVQSTAYVMFKHPDPNYQNFLIAFFVTLVFVVIICVIAFKIFKVDIVLFYRRSCFAKTNLNDGKKYDAYIMYPKNTNGNIGYTVDIFVLKVLPEVLEGQCSYQLFIFGRDDIPGQAITDAIEEAISQSRRLIIILGNTTSENRLENEFEQHIAMYDALIRNKTKVILVELEKITDYSNMPESIKYIKQKQGVVQWKGEITEASLSSKTKFWKNIRYRMPPEQRKHSKGMGYITSESL
ncbi:interleukin-1 receptor type 1-like [Spea bombifrons]|uniref:interleukin-1 receptor type 1-like n=1 Tax=Spea bombifrons TaxID=233779 RepID=UPI00234AA245|nr:interleukin-1 receptor type 1-like [Spea bombifrons]XP_053311084.1 interleukin-1 receptor type 1-like [Spea bombifrons]